MLKLTNIAKDFIQRHGEAFTVETTGAKLETVRAWAAGTSQPNLQQVEKLLDADPDPINTIKPLYEGGLKEGQRLAICMNTNRQVDWRTMQSLAKLYESEKMQLIIHPTNFIVRGRNQLARRFLESHCEWSLWVDDDMVLPCGDANWFKTVCQAPNFPDTYAGLNTIGRLLHHGKTLIGGCYFDRINGGKAQFNDAAASQEINQDVKQGPRNDIRKTKWIAAGCTLIHRSVFEDIASKGLANKLQDSQAQYLRYTYGFFDPSSEGMGEDVSFCLRAEKAGHQPYVDLSVMPGHVGSNVYNYYSK